MSDVIDRLIELEADVCYQNWPAKGEEEFSCTLGTLPILLSAPHGAVHTRDGHDKPEDEFTAGIARLVAERTGAHAIWLRRKSSGDANRDHSCLYKAKLERLVRDHAIACVLDIHGAAESRKFGIALGTSSGRSCSPRTQEAIVETMSRFGFAPPDRAENKPAVACIKIDISGFRANGSGTITRYAAKKLHVDAAQLELNAHLRIPRRREDASSNQPFETCDLALIVETVKGLSELVRILAEAVSPLPLATTTREHSADGAKLEYGKEATMASEARLHPLTREDAKGVALLWPALYAYRSVVGQSG